jgi:excisionase family DNA binding protein
MSELLTAKQVQDILKVDRTTVYRMLADGRLEGIKVGQQWRFPAEHIEAMLSRRMGTAETSAPSYCDFLPISCVQGIQDVVAEVAGVTLITVSPDGQAVTAPSNNTAFCRMIQSSPAGEAACEQCRRLSLEHPKKHKSILTCHVGLQQAYANIEVDGKLVAAIIASQFFASEAEKVHQIALIPNLAQVYSLDQEALAKAAQDIPVLSQHDLNKLPAWLDKIARTMGHMGQDRAVLVGRLGQISALSTL